MIQKPDYAASTSSHLYEQSLLVQETELIWHNKAEMPTSAAAGVSSAVVGRGPPIDGTSLAFAVQILGQNNSDLE